MSHSDIELMAQGFPPSSIGKDHEEVVTFLATSLLAAQQKLDVAIKRGDACMQAGIVWEKAMMAAIGEDGVGCVVKAISALKAQRDALAAENAALKDLAELYANSADELHSQITGLCESDCRRQCFEDCNKTPATDAYLNAIRAEGVIMFASKQLAPADELDSTIPLERLMLDADELAGHLRAN